MELISVIVPVYNVEKYLDRCVDSLVNQVYKNLEIILVDDGSPDNCPTMCDAWAQKDSRIKVIHKENGGLSDARNAGMAVATGDYIGFVDSDDYISNNMYQLLHERMISEQSDIAACGVTLVYEDSTSSKELTPEGSYILDNTAAMKAVICESLLKQPVWYKLYKASCVQDIQFPKGKYHEDVFWTWQAVARAKKISVFDTPCYFYLQRGNSIMGESFSLNRLDALEAKCQRMDFLQQNFSQLVPYAGTDLFFTQLYMGQQALLCSDKIVQKTVFKRLQATQKTYPLSLASWRSMSMTYKVWAIMVRISLPMTCRIRNYLGIGK